MSPKEDSDNEDQGEKEQQREQKPTSQTELKWTRHGWVASRYRCFFVSTLGIMDEN